MSSTKCHSFKAQRKNVILVENLEVVADDSNAECARQRVSERFGAEPIDASLQTNLKQGAISGRRTLLQSGDPATCGCRSQFPAGKQFLM